jgi:hypothetical protein
MGIVRTSCTLPLTRTSCTLPTQASAGLPLLHVELKRCMLYGYHPGAIEGIPALSRNDTESMSLTLPPRIITPLLHRTRNTVKCRTSVALIILLTTCSSRAKDLSPWSRVQDFVYAAHLTITTSRDVDRPVTTSYTTESKLRRNSVETVEVLH